MCVSVHTFHSACEDVKGQLCGVHSWLLEITFTLSDLEGKCFYLLSHLEISSARLISLSPLNLTSHRV